MIDQDLDIAIVGGGLVGLTLLHALAATGMRCLLVDKQALSSKLTPNFDSRSLALSAASVRILSMLSLWPAIEPKASPIQSIHVSEQGRFGSVLLQHPNPEQALGYVVDMPTMYAALQSISNPKHILAPAQLTTLDVQHNTATLSIAGKCQTIRARLWIAADGADSKMRTWCGLTHHTKAYDHAALVTNIGLDKHHQNRAYERFVSTGPVALLPSGPKRMALVWSMLPADAQRLLHVNESEFLRALADVIGYRLGRLLQVGQRALFPLQQTVMDQQIHENVVFIGNAAHTLHPVAAQGFNLALRDVAMLVQLINQHGLADRTALLNQYQSMRQSDQKTTTWWTDRLVQLFTHSHSGIGCLRQIGLIALDNSERLKRLLSRYASGLGGIVPDLVCGIPLQEAACLMT